MEQEKGTLWKQEGQAQEQEHGKEVGPAALNSTLCSAESASPILIPLL